MTQEFMQDAIMYNQLKVMLNRPMSRQKIIYFIFLVAVVTEF